MKPDEPRSQTPSRRRNSPRAILLFAIFLLLGWCMLPLLFKPNMPMYQGRSLAEWFDEVAELPRGLTDQRSLTALAHFGIDAQPLLRDWAPTSHAAYCYVPRPLAGAFAGFIPRLDSLDALERVALGERALRLLGDSRTNAWRFVPEFRRMWGDSNQVIWQMATTAVLRASAHTP